MNTEPRPEDIKSKQKRNLIVGSVLVLLVGFWLWSVLESNSSPASRKPDKTENTNFDTPLKNIDNQGYMLNRTQNQLANQQRAANAMQSQIDMLAQSKDKEDTLVKQQAQTIKQLQSDMEDIKNRVNSHSVQTANNTNSNFLPNGTGTSSDGLIDDDKLQLTPRKIRYDRVPDKNPDTFVPAGTFASAIALGGADHKR